MWGSDYPHDEGTAPFTREHLRQVMHDLPEADKRAILGENAAKLYGFDLDALGAARRRARPDRRGAVAAAHRAAGEAEQRPAPQRGTRRPRLIASLAMRASRNPSSSKSTSM